MPSGRSLQMSPLGDRLLVKPQEVESKTSGGILLAPTSSGRSMQDALVGTVLAVGDDVDIGVATGDRVLFSKYSSSGEATQAWGQGALCTFAEGLACRPATALSRARRVRGEGLAPVPLGWVGHVAFGRGKQASTAACRSRQRAWVMAIGIGGGQAKSNLCQLAPTSRVCRSRGARRRGVLCGAEEHPGQAFLKPHCRTQPNLLCFPCTDSALPSLSPFACSQSCNAVLHSDGRLGGLSG